MKKSILRSIILMIAVSFFIYSCDDSGEEATGKSILRISLTDSPGDYKAVYVDIQEIRVNATDDENSGWVTLEDINAGVMI